MILSPEHQLLRDTLADFAERELKPHAARWADAHEFPAQALHKLGASRAELEEMLAVAVYMGGGPALMYAAEAIAAWDALENGTPT